MTLIGDEDLERFWDALSDVLPKVFGILRDVLSSFESIFEQLAEEIKKETIQLAQRQPHAHYSAERSVTRAACLFRRHYAATMRFHIAATGD